MTGPTDATKEKEVFYLPDPLEYVPHLIRRHFQTSFLTSCTLSHRLPALSCSALVPHFSRPQSGLPHIPVVIVLGWPRPWTFLEGLHTWLARIGQWVKDDSVS